ncbi:ABC transporter permease [Pseudonocardia bannensis]
MPTTTTSPARTRPRRRRATGAPPFLVGWGAIAGLVALVPLVYLVVRSLDAGPGAFLEVLGRPRTGELILRSLALAGAVTAACMVIGFLGAWLVVRTDLPGRRAAGVLLALPLAVPSYVAGFTWISEAPGLAGFWGAFGVLVSVSFPYVFLPVVGALRATDTGLEEVARSLGHGPARVLLGVTLRQVWPAATAGGLLVALYILSDFGAVSLMRYDTFTLGIYTSYRGTFNRTPAAVLGCVLVVLAALITWGEARARGRAAQLVGRGVPRQAAATRLGRWRPAWAGFVGLVIAVSLGVPAYSLTHWMVVGSSLGVDLPDLGDAGLVTLQAAAAGAIVTTVLAIPVGVLAARYRGRATATLETATYVGHALPGITVGLALVFLGVRVLPGIYQELPLLVFGYAVLFLPLAVGAVRTAVVAAPPRLEEVSRSLGHSRFVTLARVTLPLAAPGVGAGAALVFLTIAKELPATLMLRPTGADTLAVRLWSYTGVGQYAAAAPYAVLLVLLAAIPTLVLNRAFREHDRALRAQEKEDR